MDIHVEVKLPHLERDKFPDLSQEDFEKMLFDKMLKRFNRKVQKLKCLDRYREKQYFTKPSLRRHHERQSKLYLKQFENSDNKIKY